jgi:hypothetical protein
MSSPAEGDKLLSESPEDGFALTEEPPPQPARTALVSSVLVACSYAGASIITTLANKASSNRAASLVPLSSLSPSYSTYV